VRFCRLSIRNGVETPLGMMVNAAILLMLGRHSCARRSSGDRVRVRASAGKMQTTRP
jgi:hypothetical protein